MCIQSDRHKEDGLHGDRALDQEGVRPQPTDIPILVPVAFSWSLLVSTPLPDPALEN